MKTYKITMTLKIDEDKVNLEEEIDKEELGLW